MGTMVHAQILGSDWMPKWSGMIEVVTDLDELSRGLAGRREVQHSMVFLPQLDPAWRGMVPVTMEGMLVAIDILWLDARHVVQWMMDTATGGDPLANPGAIVIYWGTGTQVLEMPSGTIVKAGITCGDTVLWPVELS